MVVSPAQCHHDIVIHPGSGDAKKNWPLENFEALAEALEKKGRSVSWCLGPAEIEGMSRLPKGSRMACTTLSDLAAELTTARYYIGNDSGITHVSAALGVPTIALFSVSDPGVWSPRGDQVRVMHQHDVSIEEIVDRIG